MPNPHRKRDPEWSPHETGAAETGTKIRIAGMRGVVPGPAIGTEGNLTANSLPAGACPSRDCTMDTSPAGASSTRNRCTVYNCPAGAGSTQNRCTAVSASESRSQAREWKSAEHGSSVGAGAGQDQCTASRNSHSVRSQVLLELVPRNGVLQL